MEPDNATMAAYFRSVDYVPFPEQWAYHRSTARFRIATCGRRFGKLLSVATPILTPSGWTTMAAIQVGDSVYGPNGEPTQVVAKSAVEYPVSYEVTFDDKSSVSAGEDHEWAIETYTMRKSRGNGRWKVPPYKIMTTAQLARRVESVKYPDSIMLTQPVEMPVQKMPIDPYVFGVWLGDGTTGERHLTCHTDDLPTYREHFELAGHTLSQLAHKYQQRIENFPRGLAKTVPDAYRMGSVEQRLALLQGLMDTDGTVSNEQLQFDNTNEDLADLVEWLVNSLGGKGQRSSHVGKYRDASTNFEYKECKTSYRFGFNVAFPVFRLQRKLAKQSRLKQGPRTVRRYVSSVTQTETVPMQCIQVDREDGLWLAGHELVVTHNSTMVARDAVPRRLLRPNQQVWIVGPTYLLAEKEFRVIWNDLIIKKKFGKDKRVKKAYNVRTGDMHIYLPWGTAIDCRSAEHPDLLVGEGLDHVIMSEAAKHKKETWDRFIRPSLADKKGTADFATTPEGFNWFHDLFLLGRDPKFPQYEAWKFPSWYNTHVYPGGREDEEIKLLQETMDKEWFMQEVGADFASFVGKIFPDWDEFVHVRPHKYNPLWKNYIAFDFGYTNPLAAVEFQVSPTDQIYIWRVYYKSYKTIPDVVEELKAQEQPPGYKIDLMFGDPADPEAAEMLTRLMGVHCWAPKEVKSTYTWLDGIMLMRQFMKVDRQVSEDEYGTPEYEPSYFVDPGCRPVIKEHSNYRSKAPIAGRNVPEFGNKIEDHTIDAIRYALICIFKIGCQHHLEPDMVSGGGEMPELTPTAAVARQANRADRDIKAGEHVTIPDTVPTDWFNSGSGAQGFFTDSMVF